MFAALALPCAVAEAQPSIAWAAPAECPSELEVSARVQRLLGTDIDTTATARVDVERSADGYRARMRVSTPSGTGARVLENARCDKLADGVALVIALSASGTRREPASAPRFSLGATVGGLLGPMPSLAPGAAIAFGVEWSLVRLELHGGYQLPQNKGFGDGVLSGRFWLAAAGMRGYVVVRFDRLELAPGLGVEIYRLTSEGRGGATSRTGAATAWGPALGLLVRVRLSDRVALGVSSDASALVLRPRFVFAGAGTLHRPALLALSFGALTEMRF